ncbi:MAG TPA: amidohydrolase family protein [Candidatus Nitrosocosmicus sp.]|nr:amidohydrolase family protein [Candidatus Nitrosocosmicus sp.]
MTGHYKKTITKLFIVIIIFSLGHFIFNNFDAVKAQTNESSNIPNLLKTSSSEFLHAQSNNIIYTQNDTNSLQDLFILYNTNIIDGNSKLISNATIITSGNKIIKIIHKNSTDKYDFSKNYPNSSLIDLSGKYMIPGLFDMHAHVAGVKKNSFNQTHSEEILHKLLAFGITTIRNPGGPTDQSVGLKNNVSSENIIGPQIFTAGTLLNSHNISIPFVETKVNSVSEVNEEISNQAKSGIDFIKLYVGLTPDLVKEAINKAHSLGLKVIGHLYLTNWKDAANYNIDFLTHGVPVNPYLLSSQNREIFIEYGEGPFDHFLWLELVEINSNEINEMIESLVKNNVYVDPTLSVYESMTKDNPASGQHLWPKVLQLTKKMHDSGVKLLAGTDIPNFNLAPGQSLHHELELLENAGIPIPHIIQIATKNAAESLGISNSTGTIEEGKQADLLVLSSNPLKNISSIKDIEMIVNNGKVVNRTSLLSN